MAEETDLDQLLQDSLPLRQALHYDPGLDTPLERLVEMFSEEDLVQDLIAIYREHCQAYPDDPLGRTVLIRILHQVGAPESLTAVKQAVTDFPSSAYLHRLGSEIIIRDDPEAALELLVTATQLTEDPVQIRDWSVSIIDQAIGLGQPELVDEHLAMVASAAGDGSAGLLEAAELMLSHDRYAESLTVLNRALERVQDPELGSPWQWLLQMRSSALDNIKKLWFDSIRSIASCCRLLAAATILDGD